MGTQQVVDPGSIRRHFAVIGDPIEHSRSPQLHQAAYRALGIQDAAYSRIHVPSNGFGRFVQGELPGLAGVSVTMPHKRAAHALASTHDAYGALGVCNTLIPTARDVRGNATKWAGHNTDVYGVRAALDSVGTEGVERASVFGSGATALSITVALIELGCESFQLCARTPQKLTDVRELIQSSTGKATVVPWEEPERAFDTDLIASALPVPGAVALSDTLGRRGDVHTPSVAFDVLYDPSPTPLQQFLHARALKTGAAPTTFVTGAHMLAHQAARQVELMLNVQGAPVEEMFRAAFGSGNVPTSPGR